MSTLAPYPKRPAGAAIYYPPLLGRTQELVKRFNPKSSSKLFRKRGGPYPEHPVIAIPDAGMIRASYAQSYGGRIARGKTAQQLRQEVAATTLFTPKIRRR